MKFSAKKSAVLIASLSLLWVGSSVAQVTGTNFTNKGSITNTRHNLSLMVPAGGEIVGGGANPGMHNAARNNYAEVCVYCHTPHAANTTIALPLWNRTNKATTYNTYNSSTLTQPVSQPGPNSLSCLSCHDGTVAMDSIINMPTAGGNPGNAGYNQGQETSQNNAFLSTWTNPPALGGVAHTPNHQGLNSNNGGPPGNGTGSDGVGCLACHSPVGSIPTTLGIEGIDFRVINIGTDLSNDHPVGIRYPSMGPGVDFNPTTGTHNNIAYFDTDGNGKLDKGNIRLYNTGSGYEVECASCHDPHGVPASGPGSAFLGTFMRVSNNGSGLCLTCHVK